MWQQRLIKYFFVLKEILLVIFLFAGNVLGATLAR
jgi:hypothetical protein